MMASLEELHPGCLVASFTYETHHVNQQVRDITAAIVKDWRRLFKTQLDKVNACYITEE